MPKHERFRQDYARKADVIHHRLQPGVTFGLYGDETIDVIMGFARYKAPVYHHDQPQEVEFVPSDEYLQFAVTSITALWPTKENEDQIVMLSSVDFDPTIALSAPIYNGRYNPKVISEAARSAWLDRIYLEPDCKMPSTQNDHPFRTYIVGSYLDDQVLGYFCVNQILPGYIPEAIDQSVDLRVYSTEQLDAITFSDIASIHCLKYLQRQQIADIGMFELPIVAKPFLSTIKN